MGQVTSHKLARIGLAVYLVLMSGQSGGYELLRSRWPTPEATFNVSIYHPDAGYLSPGKVPWNVAFENAMTLWQQDTVFQFLVRDTYADPCRNGSDADGRNGVDFVAVACGGVGFGSTVLALTFNTTISNDKTTTTESDIVFIESWNWNV